MQIQLCVFVIATFCCTAIAEDGVLYERPLTEEEHKVERIGSLRTPIKRSVTFEELKESYREAKMPEDIIKVEFVEGDADSEHNYLRVYSIKRGYLEMEEAAEWVATAGNALLIDLDKNAHRPVDKEVRLIGAGATNYFPDFENIGFIRQVFETPENRRWSITVYDTRAYKPTTHDLFRLIVHAPYAGAESAAGLIYVWQNPRPERNPAHRTVSAAWLSGEHYMVYVGATGLELDEVIPLVAEKYPSSLTTVPNIDKTAWAKREVEIELEYLSRYMQTDEDAASNPFTLHLQRLARYANLPVRFIDKSRETRDERGKRQIYADVLAWWHAHHGEAKWDVRRCILVVAE